MDVGADRIARTAHAALRLLGELRKLSGAAVPLGWSPGELAESTVLETYPAAWLTVAGLPNRGYKRPEQRPVREKILLIPAGLGRHRVRGGALSGRRRCAGRAPLHTGLRRLS